MQRLFNRKICCEGFVICHSLARVCCEAFGIVISLSAFVAKLSASAISLPAFVVEKEFFVFLPHENRIGEEQYEQ